MVLKTLWMMWEREDFAQNARRMVFGKRKEVSEENTFQMKSENTLQRWQRKKCRR